MSTNTDHCNHIYIVTIGRIEDVGLDLQVGESVNDNHTNANIQRKKV